MRTKTIPIHYFDFEAFLDKEISFIEANFLLESPDAADTMRYFYDFSNESNKAAADKDFSKWEMADFKNAILHAGETIFFPFSSGADLEGSVNLASDETVQLADDDEVAFGLTDCFGLLVSMVKDRFVFKSAIAWGDTVHSIERDSHLRIDKSMNKFLIAFSKQGKV